MKYFVNFSVPIYCSAIIDADSEEEAWNKIGDYSIDQLEKIGYKTQIDDDNFKHKDCDVINVKPFQENVK